MLTLPLELLDEFIPRLIEPPTNCPKFLNVIQIPKYLPRFPDSGIDNTDAASPTYHNPDPIPAIASPTTKKGDAFSNLEDTYNATPSTGNAKDPIII